MAFFSWVRKQAVDLFFIYIFLFFTAVSANAISYWFFQNPNGSTKNASLLWLGMSAAIGFLCIMGVSYLIEKHKKRRDSKYIETVILVSLIKGIPDKIQAFIISIKTAPKRAKKRLQKNIKKH